MTQVPNRQNTFDSINHTRSLGALEVALCTAMAAGIALVWPITDKALAASFFFTSAAALLTVVAIVLTITSTIAASTAIRTTVREDWLYSWRTISYLGLVFVVAFWSLGVGYFADTGPTSVSSPSQPLVREMCAGAQLCIPQWVGGRLAVFGIAAGFLLLLPYTLMISQMLRSDFVLNQMARRAGRRRSETRRVDDLRRLGVEVAETISEASVSETSEAVRAYAGAVGRFPHSDIRYGSAANKAIGLTVRSVLEASTGDRKQFAVATNFAEDWIAWLVRHRAKDRRLIATNVRSLNDSAISILLRWRRREVSRDCALDAAKLILSNARLSVASGSDCNFSRASAVLRQVAQGGSDDSPDYERGMVRALTTLGLTAWDGNGLSGRDEIMRNVLLLWREYSASDPEPWVASDLGSLLATTIRSDNVAGQRLLAEIYLLLSDRARAHVYASLEESASDLQPSAIAKDSRISLVKGSATHSALLDGLVQVLLGAAKCSAAAESGDYQSSIYLLRGAIQLAAQMDHMSFGSELVEASNPAVSRALRQIAQGLEQSVM